MKGIALGILLFLIFIAVMFILFFRRKEVKPQKAPLILSPDDLLKYGKLSITPYRVETYTEGLTEGTPEYAAAVTDINSRLELEFTIKMADPDQVSDETESGRYQSMLAEITDIRLDLVVRDSTFSVSSSPWQTDFADGTQGHTYRQTFNYSDFGATDVLTLDLQVSYKTMGMDPEGLDADGEVWGTLTYSDDDGKLSRALGGDLKEQGDVVPIQVTIYLSDDDLTTVERSISFEGVDEKRFDLSVSSEFFEDDSWRSGNGSNYERIVSNVLFRKTGDTDEEGAQIYNIPDDPFDDNQILIYSADHLTYMGIQYTGYYLIFNSTLQTYIYIDSRERLAVGHSRENFEQYLRDGDLKKVNPYIFRIEESTSPS